MRAINMVRAWLILNGYDGLVWLDYGQECGCMLDDLCPCGECPQHCQAAYKLPDPDPEYGPNWLLFPTLVSLRRARKALCEKPEENDDTRG